jgi:RimJ/RimL family protein N-acetyltransferase
MSTLPRLYTPRLCLRPLTAADARRVQLLAGDARVAAYTARIPHPYGEGVAEAWIHSLEAAAAEAREYDFAITLAGTRTPGRESDPTETGYLIGVAGLAAEPDQQCRRAELGYWIGVPYWNRGFATEAARALLDFGFNRLRLHRIVAEHCVENPASGRVIQKLGMRHEGTLRSHFVKNGEFHDLEVYGILDAEWSSQRKKARPELQRRELEAV